MQTEHLFLMPSKPQIPCASGLQPNSQQIQIDRIYFRSLELKYESERF